MIATVQLDSFRVLAAIVVAAITAKVLRVLWAKDTIEGQV